MVEVFYKARKKEKSPLGCQILDQLDENLKIAKEDMIPICQDTGMAIVFAEIGQDVHIVGGNIGDAINEGVRRGYVDGFLRKSVVKDPIERVNTKDNTPALITYEIVPGDKVKVYCMAKGFGSENASRLIMLNPSDGVEGIKREVLNCVREKGANACPPLSIGIGIVCSSERGYAGHLDQIILKNALDGAFDFVGYNQRRSVNAVNQAAGVDIDNGFCC